jgi:hypothetical protein
VLIVLVARGMLRSVSAIRGPIWLPDLGLEEADEGAASARSEGPPSTDSQPFSELPLNTHDVEHLAR